MESANMISNLYPEMTPYYEYHDNYINNISTTLDILFIWLFLSILGIGIYEVINVMLIYFNKVNKFIEKGEINTIINELKTSHINNNENISMLENDIEFLNTNLSIFIEYIEKIEKDNELLRKQVNTLETQVSSLEIETNVLDKKCDETDNHLVAFISEVNVLIDAQEHRDIGHHTSTMFEARNKMRQLMHRREVYKGVENVPIDSASSYANKESNHYDSHKFIYKEHHPYSIMN